MARILARLSGGDDSLPSDFLADLEQGVWVGSSGPILHGGDTGPDSRLVWLIERATADEVAELVGEPWSVPVEVARDMAERLQRAREY